MYSSANFVVLLSLLVVVLQHVANVTANFAPPNNQLQTYFGECFAKRLRLSCITEKASLAVENSMDIDLQILPGIVLVRNDIEIDNSTGRQDNNNNNNKTGMDRLSSVLSKWMDTHSLTVEVGEEGRRRRRRRFGFLLTALMGAFGVTYGMMMKGIAVIAGKALLASKMALMIMAIIGLKKLFSKDDHQEQVVQVHTMHDEHDRNLNAALYNIRHI